MADPVGTVGAAKGMDSDLVLATRGGAGFMARLQQLGDAADRLEQAAARARIGDNIQGALAQAEGKLKAASDTQASAEAVLDDARSKAAETLKRASDAAKAADETVQKLKAKAETDAADVKAKAVAYAKKKKDDVDEALAAALASVAAAKAAEDRARAQEAEAKAAADRNAKAASLAEARANELQAKIDSLLAAVRAVT